MNQEFRCKKCGELIDMDEVIRDQVQKIADQQKKKFRKKFQ